MAARIIDGKAIAKKVRQELKVEVEALRARGAAPGLAVVLVGHGCLRDQGTDPCVVGHFGEVGDLLVGNTKLLAERRQAAAHAAEPAFEQHGMSVGGGPAADFGSGTTNGVV